MADAIYQWDEKQIERHATELLRGIGVTVIDPYNLRVGPGRGGFKIDALGIDEHDTLVVAEFKAVQDKGVIGQVLSYCEVVEETAKYLGYNDVRVRGIVASNNVEASWIQVAKALTDSQYRRIDVYLVTEDPADRHRPVLVPASLDAARVKAGPVGQRTHLIEALHSALKERQRPRIR